MSHLKLSPLVVGILLGFSLPAQSALIDLSGEGFVQYGDAQSYSLPISQIDVDSTPGAIKDLIVVATGSDGVPVTTNDPGMDDAYQTPSGESGSNFFSTGTEADPGGSGEFNNDSADTWDISLLSLKSFLNDEALIFLFNNNNLNGANEQSLAAWMQISVYDDLGNLVTTDPGAGSTTDTAIFDLTNDNSLYGLVSEGGGGTFLGDVGTYQSDGSGPDGNTNADTDYVLSGGPICLDTDFFIPTPVSCSSPEADEGPINHNLGADNAAYAVYMPELSALLDSLFSLSDAVLAEFTMSIDLRLGCDPILFPDADASGTNSDDEICTGALSGFGKNLNNGFEQLFIATATVDPPTTNINEPATLLLFGLAGLLLARSKRLV